MIGALDFAVAVGAGLTFSLIGHPQMATIAAFPLALIPLFGVTISGATHVMAFHLLGRSRGPALASGAKPPHSSGAAHGTTG